MHEADSSRSSLCYLGGSVVEHLLPGGIQCVLPISHQALLCHIDHLPGSCVHRNRSLVAQSCLLGLLLGLQRADNH